MSSEASVEALEDIRRNLELILEFTDGMDREQFEVEYKTQYAVIRALEIAGEAVKRVPQEIWDRNQQLPLSYTKFAPLSRKRYDVHE